MVDHPMIAERILTILFSIPLVYGAYLILESTVRLIARLFP